MFDLKTSYILSLAFAVMTFGGCGKTDGTPFYFSWDLKDLPKKPEATLSQDEVVSAISRSSQGALVVFYLGNMQTTEILGNSESFFQLGLDIVAVSTKDATETKAHEDIVIKDYPQLMGKIHFLADPELKYFKKYQAYNELESTTEVPVPLNGLLLVKHDGTVLWKEISALPFADINFVSTEAQRLLPLQP